MNYKRLSASHEPSACRYNEEWNAYNAGSAKCIRVSAEYNAPAEEYIALLASYIAGRLDHIVFHAAYDLLLTNAMRSRASATEVPMYNNARISVLKRGQAE